MEEIRKVFFSCSASKAPGPDGFSFLFYQTFWDLISSDFMKLVNAFYYHNLDISKINMASVCLAPKRADANTITQFRPISLINCNVKIITKLLADRLSLIMDSLIDYTQTTYIKGRCIMDSVVCLHEILHSVRENKVKGALFKINFEKAFDKVNWDFLLEILEGRNFGGKWIKLRIF